jgi:serine/threonine protein kinase
MAKVLMGGMAQMHAAGIVHADLKPENVMLIRDSTLGMKYRLRIIDMDFSLLTDKTAPWHGDRGYFGTPGYLSPEHLREGCTPSSASDVFTLGLMLHELLSGKHPYRNDSGVGEDEAILRHAAKPLQLRPGLDSLLPNANQIVSTVHRCLAPNLKDRPTAQGVLDVLNNRLPVIVGPSQPPSKSSLANPPPNVAPSPPKPSSPTTVSVPPPNVPLPSSKPSPPPAAVPPAAAVPPRAVGRLVLVGSEGQEIRTSQQLFVGRALVKGMGDDAKYVADTQFRLERAEDGWYVEPILPTPNQTLLNGKRLTGKVRVVEGDVIAVGKEEKNVVKLPLTVRIR